MRTLQHFSRALGLLTPLAFLVLPALLAGCVGSAEETQVQLPGRRAVLPGVAAAEPEPTTQVIGGKGKETYRSSERVAAAHASPTVTPSARPPVTIPRNHPPH